MWSYHLLAYCSWHLTPLQSSSEPRKGDGEKAEKGRSSKLAQRIVRSISGERGENWMYWWERERFRGPETQISRKKVWSCCLGNNLLKAGWTGITQDQHPPGTCGRSSSPAMGAPTTGLLSCGRRVHCSPWSGAILHPHGPPQPPLSGARPSDSAFPPRQRRQPHFLCGVAVKMN